MSEKKARVLPSKFQEEFRPGIDHLWVVRSWTYRRVHCFSCKPTGRLLWSAINASRNRSEMLLIEMNTKDCVISHLMHCMICGLVGLPVNAILLTQQVTTRTRAVNSWNPPMPASLVYEGVGADRLRMKSFLCRYFPSLYESLTLRPNCTRAV